MQLNLPVLDIQFTGLSKLQTSSLRENYKQYTAAPDTSTNHFECQAYKPDKLPKISSADLARDGQYAPRTRRLPNTTGIELTGIEFVANIELETDLPSTLGVVEEHEFAEAPVIENFLRVMVAHRALQCGGTILHSAGLVFDGEAYIFQGYSNAGKTTLTRKAHARGAGVLSDDINLLLPDKQGFRAHAVPFTGEFGRTLDHHLQQASYPVAGIILLEQGETLKTESLSAAQAVARLLTGCPFVNMAEEESEALFDAVTAMVDKLPVSKLQCRLDDDIDDIMTCVKQVFKASEEEVL